MIPKTIQSRQTENPFAIMEIEGMQVRELAGALRLPDRLAIRPGLP